MPEAQTSRSVPRRGPVARGCLTITALVAAGLAAGLPLGAAPSDPPPAEGFALEQLSWLSGCWRSDACEEFWSPLSANGLAGVCRMEQGLRAPIYELLLIEREGADVVYRMKQFGPGLVERQGRGFTLKLRSVSPEHARFENPDQEFPRRIDYRRVQDDQLIIRLEGERNGTPRVIEFSLKRA